jgi:hypothetical protein
MFDFVLYLSVPNTILTMLLSLYFILGEIEAEKKLMIKDFFKELCHIM